MSFQTIHQTTWSSGCGHLILCKTNKTRNEIFGMPNICVMKPRAQLGILNLHIQCQLLSARLNFSKYVGTENIIGK